MSQINHDESEAFSLDIHSWEKLLNDDLNNSENGKEKNEDEEVNKKGKNKGETKTDNEVHVILERQRRKKMKNMFSDLQSLIPQLPHKVDKITLVDEAVSYIKTLQSTFESLQKQKLDRLNSTRNVPSYVIVDDDNNNGNNNNNNNNNKGNNNNNDNSGVMAKRSMNNNKGNNNNNNDNSGVMAKGSMNNNNGNNNNNNNNDNSGVMVKESMNLAASSSQNAPTINTLISPNVVLNTFGNNEAQFTVYAVKKPQLFTALCTILKKHHLDVAASIVSSGVDRCFYTILARVNEEKFDQLNNNGEITMENICMNAANEMILCVTP